MSATKIVQNFGVTAMRSVRAAHVAGTPGPNNAKQVAIRDWHPATPDSEFRSAWPIYV